MAPYISGAQLNAKQRAEVRGTFVALVIIMVIVAAGLLGVYYFGILIANPVVEVPELAPHEWIQSFFSAVTRMLYGH